MSRSGKILLGFFFILLTIILAEIGYYFFSQQKINVLNNPTLTNITIFPSPTVKNEGPFVQDSALNSQSLNNLLILKKGVVSSSILTNTYTGTLIDLDIKGGELDDFEYKLKLKIKGKNDLTNGLYYTESDIKNLRITKSSEGTEPIVVGPEKLEIGDNLVITETTDLTKNFENAIIKLEIHIL